MKRIAPMAALAVALSGAAADDAPPPPSQDAPAQEAERNATQDAATPAQEEPRDDAEADVFVPSEDISEDLSVRFPVDI